MAIRPSRAFFLVALLLCLGCADHHPRSQPPGLETARFALVVVHWGLGQRFRERDSTEVEVSAGEDFGSGWYCDNPFQFIRMLDPHQALVRYGSCLHFVRPEERFRGTGPIGPESLAVTPAWGKLSTHVTDSGCEYLLRLIVGDESPLIADSMPTRLWHDRYSPDRPAFGEWVDFDQRPVAIHEVEPEIPAEARNTYVGSRTVLIQALIGRDGTVQETRVVQSMPGLDEAAIECLRKWRFRPALWKGEPVAIWMAVAIAFQSPGPDSTVIPARRGR